MTADMMLPGQSCPALLSGVGGGAALIPLPMVVGQGQLGRRWDVDLVEPQRPVLGLKSGGEGQGGARSELHIRAPPRAVPPPQRPLLAV